MASKHTRTWCAMLAALCLNRCQCDDTLASATGDMHLELCDRSTACGCEVLDADVATIEFSSPAVGASAYRTLVIKNDNQPMKLVVSALEVTEGNESFAVAWVKKRSSAAADAEVTSLDISTGDLVLKDEEEAEVQLRYAPQAESSSNGTLVIVSNSSVRPRWTLALRAGSGSTETSVPDGTCPAEPPEGNATNCSIDFGTANDEDLGYDSAAGLPVALGEEAITLSNTGAGDVFVTVELTDDGIPETDPSELVGDYGVFHLGDLGCTLLHPGEQLSIPVTYRPFTAGEHVGEVVVQSVGEPIHIALYGRVIGAHICFETEDGLPDDAVLQFGNVAQNSALTRRIWAENCGYQQDLTISDVTTAASTPANYSSASIPWTATEAIAPGERIELPVTFTPSDDLSVGSAVAGRLAFASNDSARPTSYVDLSAAIGAPEQCQLVASPDPVDFGWIAADEAGSQCVGFFCLGQQQQPVSRTTSVVLTNAGLRDCTNISWGTLVPDASSTDMFSYVTSPLASGFTLAPGESADPIELLFAKTPTEPTTNHFAKLPFRSDDAVAVAETNCPAGYLCVDMMAKAGGSPDCQLYFQPVTPAGAFCANETLAFGNVNIGQEKTIDLQVINTGSDTCTLTNVAITTSTSITFSVAPPSLPYTLPVNQAVTVPVSFAPIPASGDDPFEEIQLGCGIGGLPFAGATGSQGLQCTYYSGTSGSSRFAELALAGVGTRPDIDVIPGEIDFGEVTVGCCSAERRVAVYNSGDGTLTISSVGILESSDPTFEVTTQPTDLALEPGESTEFYVRWCADAESAHSGILEIQSTDDNEEYFTVALSGTGTLDSAATDEFQQPLRPKVDVLWAVDDSGSMSEEQDNLANNFDAFIDAAVSLNTDYHIGVVNTDVESEDAGKLYSCVGSPLWVSDTQPAATQQSQFTCNVKTTDWPRPHSDSKEAALGAARAAVDYPNIDGFNAGFYREDAKLYVLLVTDEVDQSDGSAQQYVDYFRNLKGLGNTDLLNISAISGPPPDGCPTADENQKGYDAVQLVGGQFRSICTADWSDLLTSLGLDVFTARQQFPLSRPATPDTITVSVCDANGQNCTTVAQDANNGWTFDADLNAVTFHGDAVPGAGESVSIDYIAVCY